MRLDKIKLAGFKSFVDPTTININGNLLGIVGPNGCGKSNVIDAVRWVMGESSAKHLRGESMSDVIFNGAAGRKPVGQASIEMVFDNNDGKLGGEYAKYSEISIKRQVSREGQSHYYLNGARCRRKDITGIFLGTGLGPRSYSIIEQGMISRLIEARPEDLRVFIEEAAGISKYKERRKETETRIRNTRDNIDRLNDLREEIEKRLSVLQRQSKSAERFQTLKEEERLVKAELQALRWQNLNQQAEEKKAEIADDETTLEARIAQLRANEADTELSRDQLTEANDNLNEVQGEFYAVGAEIARLEQSIQHIKETRQQQERELAETEEAWSAAQGHLTSDEEKINTLEETLDVDQAKMEEAEERESHSSESLEESEEKMGIWQQQWDEFNSSAAQELRIAEVARARVEHLEDNVTQAKHRLETLAEEGQGIDTEPLQDDVSELRETLEIRSQALQDQEDKLSNNQDDISKCRSKISKLNEAVKIKQTSLRAVREQFVSLKAVQVEALGKNSGKLNQWLSNRSLDAAPRLAQKITVEPGWEQAVETVLGYHLESVCVEDAAALVQYFNELQEGDVTLLNTRGVNTPVLSDGKAKRLESFVSAPWPLSSLLAGVYIAQNTDEALALQSRLELNESVITVDGIWLGPSWIRVARGKKADEGVLAREQKLTELATDCDRLEESVDSTESALLQARSDNQELEDARNEIQLKRGEIARVLADAQALLSGKQARLDNFIARKERVNNELEEQSEKIIRAEIEIATATTELHGALNAIEGQDQDREALIKTRDAIRLRLEEVRTQSKLDRDTYHELKLQCQSMSTQLTATRENLTRVQSQVSHLVRRRDELYGSLSGGEEPVTEMAETLELQLEKRLEVETILADSRRTVENINHQLRELAQQRQEVEQTINTVRTRLDQHRMAWQEVNVRCQTILEQIVEAQFEVNKLLEEIDGNATESIWSESVERIERSIQRLGAINLAAIDEFAEQTERKEYLDAQYEDLNKALDTLEAAIHKIDKETRTRFKDTFDKINTGLQAKFPLLFGGGHAYMELTGEDLLDTGVTIMARPPGKRNSTIHLLSGGEKALTAVALVFSIFDLNPSPFCMLDEVDAPLDDANVGRFCELVKVMSEHVQFIFITHNKITMAMANQLIGVTMHEPGVSRLVSVDIDEAAELAVA